MYMYKFFGNISKEFDYKIKRKLILLFFHIFLLEIKSGNIINMLHIEVNESIPILYKICVF